VAGNRKFWMGVFARSKKLLLRSQSLAKLKCVIRKKLVFQIKIRKEPRNEELCKQKPNFSSFHAATIIEDEERPK